MRVLLLALVLQALACAAEPESITPSQVQGPFTWGGVENVTHLRHLWFAGQPDPAALAEAKARGVEVVINLRDPAELAELGFDEAAAAEALGLAYYNVPVSGSAPFSREAFERIESVVAAHEDAPILIHCSSSNRVGGWLATHLVESHGLSVDEALAVGRRAGITKPAIEAKVRAYLGEDG